MDTRGFGNGRVRVSSGWTRPLGRVHLLDSQLPRGGLIFGVQVGERTGLRLGYGKRHTAYRQCP